MSVSEIDTIYGALEYAKWDKKTKRVDTRHTQNLSREDDTAMIEARKDEIQKSLAQTLREIERMKK